MSTEKSLYANLDLQFAIQANNVEEVQKQLDRGVSANAANQAGQHVLCFAIQSLQQEVAIALIAGGADIHSIFQDNGCNPLQFAAKKGLPKVVLALLEAGVDPHSKSIAGRDARDFAIEYGNHPVVAILDALEIQKIHERVGIPGFGDAAKRKGPRP